MAKHPGDRYPNSMGFVSALAGESPTATAGPLPSANVSGAGVSGVKTTVKQVTPVPSAKTAASMGTAQRSPVPRRSAPVDTGGNPVPGGSAPSHRSTWLIAALLVAVGALGALVMQGRGREGSDVAPQPADAAASADSFAGLQREQSIENAKLQKQLDDARRIALDAERKVEQMAAAQTTARGAGPKAAVAEAPHAHLLVLARGGAPQVWVDGARKSDKTPAALELPPGRHSVSVKGSQAFLPSEFKVELSPDDTQQVVFVSKTVADAGAAPRRANQAGGRRGQGPNWDQVTRNLGFDPRTVRPDTLAPAQRRQYQKFMQRLDSARKANRPPPS